MFGHLAFYLIIGVTFILMVLTFVFFVWLIKNLIKKSNLKEGDDVTTCYWKMRGAKINHGEKVCNLSFKGLIIIAAIIMFILIGVPTLIILYYEISLDKIAEKMKTEKMDEDIVVDLGPELSGRVRDGLTKEPLTASVKVMANGESFDTIECDKYGKFYVQLEDGDYELIASHPGYVAKGKNNVSRKIEINGKSLDLGNLDLWPEAKVTGRVVSDNKGVDAELRFYYQIDDSGSADYLFNTLRTDEHGYFSLDMAYGGVQRIELNGEEFVGKSLKDIVLSPGETVDLGEIPVNPGLTVFGIVKDKASNKGIPNATIKFIDLHRKVLIETKSSEDGSYTLPVTDMRKLQITVIADGYAANNTLIAAKELNRYEHNVALAKNTNKTSSQKNKADVPDQKQGEKLTGSEAQAAAKQAFEDNEAAFQQAMSIHLNDVPEGMPVDVYLQQQLPLKAAAVSMAAAKYSEIIQNYDPSEVSMTSLIRLGTMFQSVADEIMAAPIPTNLPDEAESQYIGIIENFALQFTEKEVEYYESALKISSELNIVNDDVKRVENQLSNIRY